MFVGAVYMEGGRSYTQIITGLIVNLFWNTILINRFFIFRTVFVKCLKNVPRLAWKLTRNSFKAFHKSVPSWRKLYPFASKACKKAYLNKTFIWESFLSDFLPILIDKTWQLRNYAYWKQTHGSNSPMWREDEMSMLSSLIFCKIFNWQLVYFIR